MTNGKRSKRQLSKSLRWPIHIVSSVDTTIFFFYSPTDAASQFFKTYPPHSFVTDMVYCNHATVARSV